jgi:hypothetical protein
MSIPFITLQNHLLEITGYFNAKNNGGLRQTTAMYQKKSFFVIIFLLRRTLAN